jgi:Ca2+-binding RTX toxin-like protein
MELILLAALGLGALSLVFGGDDAAPGRSDAPDRDNGDDTDPPDDTAGNVIELSSGVPNPEGTSGNDTFSGIVEGSVRGGAGSDRFSFDNGYGAVISGGAGNDSFVGGMGDGFTLYGEAGNDLFAFDTDVFDGAVAYGGAGNDRFDLDFSDSDVQPGATLSGGDGADIYDLTFSPGMADRAGGGKMVTIKDFKLGEDQLNVTFTDLDRAELVENSDGNYSDLNLHYITTDDAGATVDRYMRLRLEGITGATLESLGLNLPVTPPDETNDQGRLYEISPGGLGLVEGGVGNDTITGLADGRFLGGGGDDLFDIETGADAVLDAGAGNDTLNVGEGVNYTILGGAGNDVLNIDSTSNTQESSTIDAGDDDDVLNIDVALSNPTGQRTDLVSGGAGADSFSINLTQVFLSDDFTTDALLRIADFSTTEDEFLLTIRPEDAPFYKGAELFENSASGSTDLVLTFERTATDGTVQQWTGTITFAAATGLSLSDDGPIQIQTAA